MTPDRRIERHVAAVFAVIAALFASIPTAAVAEDGFAALQRPGVALLMRHALAPGTGDPASFSLDDCATQRNLSDEGRAQAGRIGETFERRGVAFDRILTSQWCRCRETAEILDLGEVEDFPPLNSFFQDRSTADAQTEEVLAFLAALPDDQRVLLVTHQVNVTALTGVFPKSGEAIVVDLSPDGGVEVLGSILIEP